MSGTLVDKEVKDNISELTLQAKKAEIRSSRKAQDALMKASKAYDEALYDKKEQRREIKHQQHIKRNEDFTLMVKVLAAFLLFDFATREILFHASLPHLKALEENRSDSLTKVFALISEMSDKYAYVVIIGASYHFLDVSNAFIVTTTIYTALGVLSISKSFLHEARPFFVSQITPT